MDEKDKQNLDKSLFLLNQALHIEYSFIIHYPRIASNFKDAEIKEMIQALGKASMHHADVVADVITRLGGNPDWSFEMYHENMDDEKLFQTQLLKEKKALQLHTESANLLASTPYSVVLSSIAKEEEQHIQIVEHILSRLKQQQQ